MDIGVSTALNDFYIEFPDSNRIGGHCFGAFSGLVKTPDEYICTKGDKPFSRFFYVEKGTIIFNKGTKDEIYANAGNIVYLPNNITYKSQWPAGEDGKYMSVNFQLDEQYIKLPNKICIAATDRNDYYKNMFEHICGQWLRGAFGYKLEVLSEIYRLLYSLMNDSLHRRTKTEHHAIYKGILYLENNYMTDISVKELSDMCSVSESSFRRLFKQYKKMSPITYKNYLRIIKAADLLRSGEYSVKEAAYAVSLPDICYFYKLFTRFMCDTPKNFIPSGSVSEDKAH